MPKKYILTSPDEDDSEKPTYYNKDKEWWQTESTEECAYDTEDEARVEQIFLKMQYRSNPNHIEYPINIQSIE
ncbi:hypothetical protein A6S26_34705 [Nostoc sp. ATCC 43529]|nr:hypothetical protein A6S26_34705 [Nostoc sp. ATCC 43529]